MSRGYGRVQRSILDWLASEPEGLNDRGIPMWSTITDAAKQVYETDSPTDAQIVAVRRAVRGLVADGVIDTDRGWCRPEKVRRRKLALRVQECDGDGCEWCETGIPRYTGTWLDEGFSKEYPYWSGRKNLEYEGPWLVGFCVKYGNAWHIGEMAPRYRYDSVSITLIRRALTDDEQAAEKAAAEARKAKYAAEVKAAAEILK